MLTMNAFDGHMAIVSVSREILDRTITLTNLARSPKNFQKILLKYRTSFSSACLDNCSLINDSSKFSINKGSSKLRSTGELESTSLFDEVG